MNIKEAFYYSILNDLNNIQKIIVFDKSLDTAKFLRWCISNLVNILFDKNIYVDNVLSTPLDSKQNNLKFHYKLETQESKHKYEIYICVTNSLNEINFEDFKDETIFISNSINKKENQNPKLFFSKNEAESQISICLK
jgi:hypothetical protein